MDSTIEPTNSISKEGVDPIVEGLLPGEDMAPEVEVDISSAGLDMTISIAIAYELIVPIAGSYEHLLLLAITQVNH